LKKTAASSKSRSRSQKRTGGGGGGSPLAGDPRQQIYEAKFEKYLANKKAKDDQKKKRESSKKDEFDIWTKSASSPSKLSKRFAGHHDPTKASFSGKFT